MFLFYFFIKDSSDLPINSVFLLVAMLMGEMKGLLSGIKLGMLRLCATHFIGLLGGMEANT